MTAAPVSPSSARRLAASSDSVTADVDARTAAVHLPQKYWTGAAWPSDNLIRLGSPLLFPIGIAIVIGWLLQHLQFVRKALRGRSESPRRLATAVALGVLLGLIPKGNLIAAAVTVIILGSTANAGLALLTATVVSFAAVLVDPVSHRIGLSILTHNSLYPFWQAMYQVPVVPWSNFNHTVVFGGSIVGLAMIYPAYRLSYAFFNRNNVESADDVERVDEPDVGEFDVGQPPSISIPVAEVVRLQGPKSLGFGCQRMRTFVSRCCLREPGVAASDISEADAPAEHAIPELHEPSPACEVLMLSEASSPSSFSAT